MAVSDDSLDRAWQRQRRALVVDTHVHGQLMARPLWRAYRAVNGPSMPADVPFSALPACGVDAVIASAVGDRLVTMWNRGSPMAAVARQLERIRAEAGAMHARVVVDAAGVRRARADGRTAVLLGVEGADMVGDDLDRLDTLRRWGVRHLGLVHFADNAIGTICTSVTGIATGRPRRPGGRSGLTAFGGDVVERCASLGIVIDVAHADDTTIDQVCARSPVPVVSTHTGARHVRDFARYLADAQVEAIAATGGYVGLWPFRYRRHGCPDVDEWIAHARHLVDLVGAEHVAVGTDMNGVPATMEGYRDERDFPVLTDALLRAGLDGADLDAVLGGNALRVLEETEAAAVPRTMTP